MLVHRASATGFGPLGGTLVMVADPDDEAIRVSRGLGFVEAERQLGVDRPTGRLSGGPASTVRLGVGGGPPVRRGPHW